MPCENCNAQFTFLKRKRNCNECSRFYCAQCLEKRNSNIYLCEKCVVFTTRPISKVDLLKLKPKDLIFYLQSKHISTAGCVEKEELVNLVLAHINSDTGQQIPNIGEHVSGPEASSGNGFDNNCSNPFDQFKQTCQNFFTTFTGKISSDLNFESRGPTSNTQQNISEQPRVTTRKIPTYASSINTNNAPGPQTVPTINLDRSPTGQGLNYPESTDQTPYTKSSRNSQVPQMSHLRDGNSSSSLSSPSSPIISISSLSSQSLSFHSQATKDPEGNLKIPTSSDLFGAGDQATSAPISPNTRRVLENVDGNLSGCECSDDEIITRFQARHRLPSRQPHKGEKSSPTSQTDSAFEDQIPGPSGSAAGSNTPSKSSSGNQKLPDDSSGSSFEELGAVGGGSPSDNDYWQFVNKTEMTSLEEVNRTNSNLDSSAQSGGEPVRDQTSQTFLSSQDPNDKEILAQERKKSSRRLIRRRSDSSIYTQKRNGSDLSHFPQLSEESDGAGETESSHKRQRKCCTKCGKNKKNMKKCIAKFIKQLQTTKLSAEEIRQEANAFLVYLQNRESFDCSDSDSNAEESGRSKDPPASIHRSNSIMMESPNIVDDGIHVYAQNASDSVRQDSRFLNIWDIKSSTEIDELSVKQLKEILMLNRVDYKGCCEKQELLERVYRLWNDFKTSPAVDKLDVDELCKICMDAPIECVMLECGHMATCTSCGKVLSECPICRQYVVRVVRFFKA